MGRAGRLGRVGCAAALVAVALGAGWSAPVGAQGGATAVVTVDPDPPVGFEPFTVTVTGQGCEPGATVEAVLLAISQHSDSFSYIEVAQADVAADGAGAWVAELPVEAGAPVEYWVQPGCGAGDTFFDVPPPAGFAESRTAAPTTVTRGVPVAIEIAGEGCPASEVRWEIGFAMVWEPTGSVPVAADGTWAGTATFTVPEGYPFSGDEIGLRLACIVDEVYVHYDAVPVQVLPTPTTTTTTTTLPGGGGGGDPGGPVVPRFAG